MNKSEQRMKLWCDVYVAHSQIRHYQKTKPVDFAEEAVKEFDDFFSDGKPKITHNPESMKYDF